jgi:hypothetical protein
MLNRIASAIDNSKNPSRDLVAQDLRKILANLELDMGHTGEIEHEAGAKEILAKGLATLIGLVAGQQAGKAYEDHSQAAHARYVKNAKALAAMESSVGHGKLDKAVDVLKNQGMPYRPTFATEETLNEWSKLSKESRANVSDAWAHDQIVGLAAKADDMSWDASRLVFTVVMDGQEYKVKASPQESKVVPVN